MSVVVTIDSRRSRERPRDVEAAVRRLNDQFGPGLTRPFAITAGDELQGLLGDAAVLPELVAELVEDGGWWIGVGVGAVDAPLPTTVNAARGEAFYRARDAVEAAKRTPEGLVVRGDDRLGAAIAALAFVVGTRSAAQAETVRLARSGMLQKDVAARLGVSPQAVSKRLAAAGWGVEAKLRELVVWLGGSEA